MQMPLLPCICLCGHVNCLYGNPNYIIISSINNASINNDKPSVLSNDMTFEKRKSSLHAKWAGLTLSWTVYLCKECITWDTLCRTEGLPQEKKCSGVTSGSPFSSHVIMNFPLLCLPSVLLSSGKYLNTRNKCHCLPLTVEQMRIVESTVTRRCFLFEFWSIWSLLKSMIIHFWNAIFLRDQQAHAAVELTRGRRAEVTEWWGKKIKVAAPPWLLWKNLTLWLARSQERRNLIFYFFFICQPSWDLTTSCCETAILQGGISWAALPCLGDIADFFYATKEGNGNAHKKKQSHLVK